MKNIRLFFISVFLAAGISAIAGPPTYEAQPSPTPADENHRELFDYELDYTGNSSFFDDHGKFGNGDSLYNDFSYAHRFLITGKWYFRAGVEYERFDFDGTNNGLPDHLQTVHALLALEYVVHDHAGAGIEIQPGPYFQNNITSDSIDMPWKVWVTFPLKKDKIFAVIGAGGSIYSNPIVAPGGGIIWLFTDHFRLEGVFPKPALVYNPSDNWEFRIFGNLFYESFRTDDVITPRGSCKCITHGFNTARIVPEYRWPILASSLLRSRSAAAARSGATLISFGPKQAPKQDLRLSSSSR